MHPDSINTAARELPQPLADVLAFAEKAAKIGGGTQINININVEAYAGSDLLPCESVPVTGNAIGTALPDLQTRPLEHAGGGREIHIHFG